MRLPGWHYFRDVLILLFAFGAGLFTLTMALENPYNWLWAVPILFLVYTVWNAFVFAHPFRRRYWLPVSPNFASPNHEKILFKARDGLTLFGWYLPGRNRAALILIHGLGSMGIDLMVHAEPLVRAGYGVFLIDLRAHGSSDGDTSTYGRLEANDVAGAVDYLLTRSDVDPDKIGALGISLGAQAALRGALKTDKLGAILLEGLGPSILDDHGGRPQTLQRWVNYPFNWIYYQLCEFMMGGRDTGVLEVIKKISPRPLMLIACGNGEIYFNRMFYAAAREPRTLWELPRAQHAAGLLYDPSEYQRHVLDFFSKTFNVA